MHHFTQPSLRSNNFFLSKVWALVPIKNWTYLFYLQSLHFHLTFSRTSFLTANINIPLFFSVGKQGDKSDTKLWNNNQQRQRDQLLPCWHRFQIRNQLPMFQRRLQFCICIKTQRDCYICPGNIGDLLCKYITNNRPRRK